MELQNLDLLRTRKCCVHMRRVCDAELAALWHPDDVGARARLALLGRLAPPQPYIRTRLP